MAIIYTYPVKPTPNDNDLILISDSEDSNKTKQVKISTLPGGSGSGVSSVAATSPLASTGGGTPVISLTGLTGFGTTGQVIKVNSNADGLEWGAAGGNTLPGGSDHSVQYKNGSAFDGGNDLTFHPTNNIFSVKHTVIVKGQGNGNPAGRLILNCEQDSHAITLEGPAHSSGADYTLKFPSPAPSNQQILQSDGSGVLSWINTPSSGGGGAVDSVNTTDGTYIDLTPNSATTGAVTVTADLSAANGSSATATTRFLSKDNEWAVPTYTTDTTYNVMGGGNSYAAGLVLVGAADHQNNFLRKDGTWATTANTNIANTQLQLDDNRTLDFYDGSSVRSLSFIRTNGGSVNMFKFEADGGTAPTFTVGNKDSTYEGYIVIEGNGSNRTGQVQFQNAAGNKHTGIKATTTQAADITYTLPATQAAIGEFLKNDGTGVLSWEQAASYEEGTWIPQINLTVGGAATQSSQGGDFIKIGDFIFANFYVNISSAGYGTVTMSGLPFAADSTGGKYGTVQLFNNPDATGPNITHFNSGSVIGSNVFFKVLDASGTLNSYGLPLYSPSSSGPLASGDNISGTIIYKKA
mgnify:CR=1 FL=1